MKSPRNKTIELTDSEKVRLESQLYCAKPLGTLSEPPTGIAWGRWQALLPILPTQCIDLLFLDPPYNMAKTFGDMKFRPRSITEYTGYLREIFKSFIPYLKPTATIYICGDWKSATSIFEAASEFFQIQNRITWERSKGRGSKTNWKNNSEDIFFCTMSKDYTFNVDAVKLRRLVKSPFKGKDWVQTPDGKYRDTYPSNLWTDLTIPFWGMAENTPHPTQKPEKALAKLILASTNPGDYILDPYLGSGTTAATAAKLGRRCFGIDQDKGYCLIAQHRLEMAAKDKRIQGYEEGVFYERNSRPTRKK